MNYQLLLALVFTIEEINRNPHLLPNTTLGFEHHNIKFSEKNILLGPFLWLTGLSNQLINYNCGQKRNLPAALTGTSWAISAHIGTLLQLYKIPQVSSRMWELESYTIF